LVGKYGKTAAPAGAKTGRVAIDAREPTAGSQSVKVRYGPYLVPNKNIVNKAMEPGELHNFPEQKVDKYVVKSAKFEVVANGEKTLR